MSGTVLEGRVEMSDDSGPGVPEWVVTYGDMMSLLLTFFIMLVSLSEVVADQKYRAILDALEKRLGYRTGPLAPRGTSFPLNSLLKNLDSLGSLTNADTGRGGVRRKAIEGEDLRVYRNRQGSPERLGDPILFNAEDATLSAKAQASLDEIADKLAGKPNKVEIRAQSAYKPADAGAGVTADYHAKLLLSYKRSRNIMNFLQRKGIDRERLRMTAMAVPDSMSDEGDWLSRHLDRAEVLILDTFAVDFVGPRETPR